MAPVLKCILLLATVATLATSAAANTDFQTSKFSKNKQTESVCVINLYYRYRLHLFVNEVNYLPPMLVIGTQNGSVIRCPHESPADCETYYQGVSPVKAVLVHGEYLFAGLESGVILGCTWQQRHSCKVFYETNSEIIGLAVSGESIYAGVRNGIILQCQLNTTHSCQNFVDLGRNIYSITVIGSFIYAGSDEGRIDSCSLVSEASCSKFCQGINTKVTGISRFGDKIYGVRGGGAIQYCEMATHQLKFFGEPIIPDGEYYNIVTYNGKLYTTRPSEGIYVHEPAVTESFSLFAAHRDGISLTIAYGTYGMQSKYEMESQKCIWNGVFTCPPTVSYYRVQDRKPWEVSVEGGKLYDSQGVLIDTSDADEVHSTKAAIFVMGPDGQILQSKFHRKGFFHTSSFLAGNPVSGAGMMVVKGGKIVNITACSVHYRPDVELNKQVIDSLRQKGYTDPIDLYPCSYNYSGNCTVDDSNTNDIY